MVDVLNALISHNSVFCSLFILSNCVISAAAACLEDCLEKEILFSMSPGYI